MTLTACYSASATAHTVNDGCYLLDTQPQENVIEKMVVEKEDMQAWHIHNTHREMLINSALKKCQEYKKHYDSSPKPMPEILQRVPATDKMEKEFFKFDEHNGWWVTNQYRENLINAKLHECKALKEKVVPECEEQFYEEPEVSFWQEGGTIIGMVSAAVLGGFILGFTLKTK